MTVENKKANIGIVFGLSMGLIIGIVTDNLALWISLGAAGGIIFGQSMKKKSESENEE